MYQKDKRSIKQKEADRPKSLRITGLRAPARQLMSEAGRMRLEARKLRRAGNVEGYNELMTRAAIEKIAGEPTVKSQAFVDAQEKAKAGYGSPSTRAQQMQDLMFQFLRDRKSRGYGGLDVKDAGGIKIYQDGIDIHDPERGWKAQSDRRRGWWSGPYMNPDL